MAQDQWTAVDTFFSNHLHKEDAALQDALTASDEAGLPQINVESNQGKFLMLLVMATGAKRILEIGTLGGYSTIWLGRGTPADGHIDTLELNPDNARIAASNIKRAGLEDQVVVHIGKAVDSLKHLIRLETPPYDFIFLDADKASLPAYLEYSLRLSRPGTVILADNVVRHGEVANPTSTNPDVQGVQRYIEMVGSNPNLEATAIQTVGGKGYDGFAITVVKS